MPIRLVAEYVKPLTEAQQVLVMEYYTLTKGRGAKLDYGSKRPGKAKKLAALKQRMQLAGIPGEIIYGY